MSERRKHIGWKFWFQWVVANTAGWAVVSVSIFFLILFTFIIASGMASEDWEKEAEIMILLVPVFTALGGSVIGFINSTLQWLILRRQITGTSWWVLASTAGLAMGLTVGVVGVGIGIFTVPSTVVTVMKGTAVEPNVVVELALLVVTAGGGAVIGGMIGIMQWLVLNRNVLRASSSWWILASATGWAMAVTVYLVIYTTVGDMSPEAGIVVGSVIGGAAYGTITGTALVWMLRRSVHRDTALTDLGIQEPA